MAVARVAAVAFQGVEVLSVDVQVQMAPGSVGFQIVGLPDKAVGESRERVRAALNALGLALPAKRITMNLAPADLLKEGSHFDLPIALALLTALGALPSGEIAEYIALGELGLDGAIAPVAGVLPAAIHASAMGRGIICPATQGGEAAWAGEIRVLAAPTLIALINHFRGQQILPAPVPRVAEMRPRARSQGHQGSGNRQARARSRRGRRSQPLDDRSARQWQVDAGGAAAGHPATARAGRGA
jgi:magnesium chelatase family protein